MTKPDIAPVGALKIRQLGAFLLLSAALVAGHLAFFASSAQFDNLPTALWTVATTVSYAFIYLFPAALLTGLAHWLSGRSRGRLPAWATGVAAVAATALTHVLLFADRTIHGMYGFHINGFVLDLVATPGGIASLGAGRSTEMTAAGVVLLFFAMQAAAYRLVRSGGMPAIPARGWRWLMVALSCLTVGERIAYGFSHGANYQPILFAAEQYPLYLPTTFRKFSAALGLAGSGGKADEMRVARIELSYPLAPLDVTPPKRPPNIVWLVAESLRFDMLDPKIMPALWGFSEQAMRLERHFSGGNTTQMGIFSMFYGLYGNYWFPMLAARRSPLLMDVLQQQGYQFGLYTSQRFTYPAFDQTVFANMRPQDLHERSAGAVAWRRDEQNVDDLLGFIEHRERGRPFMAYMFFESTHANYDFPAAAAIAKPYLDDLNYLTADFARDIGRIKNRYVNAAHHVDGQIAHVIDYLRANGLLDETIVVVLGDHGEEFMERGRWGHSAEFNRFQTGTPAVLHVPGQAPRVISGITSHLDIAPTLMAQLGVANPPADYALGKNLLAAGFRRDYAVAAGWNHVAYIGSDYRVSFPYNATGAVHARAMDADDRPLADDEVARDAIRPAAREIMLNLARFSRVGHHHAAIEPGSPVKVGSNS